MPARLSEARRLRPDSPVGMPGGGKEEKASGVRSSSVLWFLFLHGVGLFIAARALTTGVTIVTNDTKHFKRISWGEGSKTQDYARSQYILYSLADCPVFGGNYSSSASICVPITMIIRKYYEYDSNGGYCQVSEQVI